MKEYIKYFKFLIIVIFFAVPSYSDSQEKEIKKIIIDKPTNERLLSPPIEQKKDAIKAKRINRLLNILSALLLIITLIS